MRGGAVKNLGANALLDLSEVESRLEEDGEVGDGITVRSGVGRVTFHRSVLQTDTGRAGVERGVIWTGASSLSREDRVLLGRALAEALERRVSSAREGGDGTSLTLCWPEIDVDLRMTLPARVLEALAAAGEFVASGNAPRERHFRLLQAAAILLIVGTVALGTWALLPWISGSDRQVGHGGGGEGGRDLFELAVAKVSSEVAGLLDDQRAKGVRVEDLLDANGAFLPLAGLPGGPELRSFMGDPLQLAVRCDRLEDWLEDWRSLVQASHEVAHSIERMRDGAPTDDGGVHDALVRTRKALSDQAIGSLVLIAIGPCGELSAAADAPSKELRWPTVNDLDVLVRLNRILGGCGSTAWSPARVTDRVTGNVQRAATLEDRLVASAENLAAFEADLQVEAQEIAELLGRLPRDDEAGRRLARWLQGLYGLEGARGQELLEACEQLRTAATALVALRSD